MSSSDEEESIDPKALNVSNDQYYRPSQVFKPQFDGRDESSLNIPRYSSPTIRHSLPAYDLWRPLFPTYISQEKFRNFHRPKLRHYNNGPQARSYRKKIKPFPIKNLTRNIYRFQKRLRNKVIKALNEGRSREEIVSKLLLIRDAKDLTAKQGELFLFEYCEENPPVLSQIGMASNVKTLIQQSSNSVRNFYKSSSRLISDKHSASNNLDRSNCNGISVNENGKSGSDTYKSQNPSVGAYKIGFDEILSDKTHHKYVYYNQPKPDSVFQVIENNLYRAPIYEHEFPKCDFLIIRTRNNFYIRSIKTIYAVGQTMPLLTIPQPTEPVIQRFRLDLSNFYIHKMFAESDTEPPSINFKSLTKLFPDYSHPVLRRRLREKGAIPGGSEFDIVFYRGHSNFGLISLLELRRIMTPEQYCINMATLAARQRLRELNYTESMILPKNVVELEPEVLAAPWNTSKAISNFLSGKSYLDLKQHLIDPTGSQGEGFSCVSWSKSPTEDQQVKERSQPKPSTGPPTAPLTFLDKNPMAQKIKREKLERLAIFQREAQRLAELQSKILSSKEELSSSEDECEEQEDVIVDDFEEQLRDLDKLVTDCKSVDELTYEKEEEQRKQMLNDFKLNGFHTHNGNGERRPETETTQTSENSFNLGAIKNKILKITRTYNSPMGKIQRTEIVREPRIIALYVTQKGGNLRDIGSTTESCNMTQGGDNNHNSHDMSTLSAKNYPNRSQSQKPNRSVSLGPSELCRAEGTVLTISKKVLDVRAMRRRRRESSVDM